MKDMKELQKEEAITRMNMLDIYEQAIIEFEKHNIINKSELNGILYWLDEDEQEMVKEFEEKYYATVYHVILNHTEFGRLYSLLYVSKHQEEWGYDKEDIKYRTICAYVRNADDDWCSEFGSIGIKSQFGGLSRVS